MLCHVMLCCFVIPLHSLIQKASATALPSLRQYKYTHSLLLIDLIAHLAQVLSYELERAQDFLRGGGSEQKFS